MRIGIGIILLIDLFIRSLSIVAFFTDDGVLPIHILKQYNWSSFYFSFHALNGELWWQILLFGLNAICIIFFIIGYRTRLYTFICWVFLTSIQNRNPFILQGGDDLLRILLFWCLFLPLGERYSILKQSNYRTSYFSLANIGYMLLPCSVLFFSACLKSSSEWHSDGTAIYYALSLDQIRLPLGTFIYQFPLLLKILTHIVLYIEFIAPVLIILPFVSHKIRLIGILCYVILFIGIAGTLYVGLFYIIGIVSIIGLLPSSIMNYFEKHFYKSKTIIKPINDITNSKSIIFLILNHFKNYIILFIICFCLMMNLGSIPKFPYALNDYIINYGKALRLEQNWGMFSPSILKDDGWFVYSGLNHTLRYIDIKHNLDTVSFEKPTPVVEEFESDRWRKFQENYVFNNNNYMRPFYCKYLIRKWNKNHPNNSISDLTIFFVKETSLPNYQTKAITKTAVCNCLYN